MFFVKYFEYICIILTTIFMNTNVAQEIYTSLIQHCGDIKNVRGVTEQALKNMRDGKHVPTLITIRKIFEANDMPAELVITVKKEGKKGKTKIKL